MFKKAILMHDSHLSAVNCVSFITSATWLVNLGKGWKRRGA